MRVIRTFAFFAAVVTLAPVALAQQGTEAAPAAAAPPGAPPPGSPPPPMMAPAPAEAEEGMRFRWGISGFGGKYFVNGTGGGIGGIDARFGGQVNRMIGFYGQPILMIGAGASVSSNGTNAATSVSAVALYGVGALIDFTFADLVFVAVGPELLRGAAAQAANDTSAAGTSSSASGEAGTFFGVNTRVGLALGSMKPNKRKAFTIGLDLHTIFTSKVTVAPVLALGFDAF
jgi:hypothetical protein